ncbi:splicing factor CC1-like protein [Trametes punicea]|nr:splicing factor CC1-like protein [Trametes punicea]
MNEEPSPDDSEARSVFVSQLAARLTARDLGYFFEDKLGEGTVLDSRIVTDRISRRSKGIGYVEFRSIDLVDKAIALSGTVVMGLPIQIQHTEAERNRLHPGDANLNLPPGVSAPHGGMQLYVGSLHFNLTESDIRQVFEPFGELEFVDLHRDPMTGRSKGYAFVQYKRAEDAKMALEQMDGFELAGRTLRVNTVHEKGSTRYTQQDSLDEAGGGNLNAASRQALMQKLARIDSAPPKLEPVQRPNIPQIMQSRSVLLKNMFDPEQETERDWDKDLADDVKGECEAKYGPVQAIKVEKESQGEIYVQFESVDAAKKAIEGLNGRWFGGRQISAAFISDAIMQAHR